MVTDNCMIFCNFATKLKPTPMKLKSTLYIAALWVSAMFVACGFLSSCCGTGADFSPADYVNPFIGTSNYGHTHPGAQLPWGMISVSPQSVDSEDGGYHATGYIAGNSNVYGLAHTNLSGVGCPDMGSVLLLPLCGDASLAALESGVPFGEEVAEAGYYSALIGEESLPVLAEVTTTLRTSIERYSYPSGKECALLLDLGRSISTKRGAEVSIVDNSTIEGWKLDGGFGRPSISHKVYFRIELSRAATSARIFEEGELQQGVTSRAKGEDVGVQLLFDSLDEPLLVKCAISYVSVENARLNMEREARGWDFDKVRTASKREWNKQLGRIEVSQESDANCEIFYSALYHALIHPNIISDMNGEYPMMGHDGKVGSNKDYDRFSVFSLWDTYRNVHPLLTLVYPEVQSQMLSSMVDIYRESGWLPKWEILSNESYVMVGDPALIVIADSYLKGISDFDYDTAYQAMIMQAFKGEGNRVRAGAKPYLDYGYIPHDHKCGEFVWGSLSTSLEYYMADWATAQMAKSMGDDKNYALLAERAKGYCHFWDSDYKLLRPKLKDGSFAEPFDEFERQGWRADGGNGYVEGTAWQYTWFVPYDIEGVVDLFGGEEPFVERLQMCFDKGYFTLGNEPDMGYPFLFNYIDGEQWRTQRQVEKCLDESFNTTTGGIPGNDDTGTTSTWALFAMMGFYPDCPALPRYTLFAPRFENITIHTDREYYSGRDIEISRRGEPKTGLQIPFTINGKRESSYFIDHQTLVDGAEIIFGE